MAKEITFHVLYPYIICILRLIIVCSVCKPEAMIKLRFVTLYTKKFRQFLLCSLCLMSCCIFNVATIGLLLQY
jgi:hypothetical protein